MFCTRGSTPLPTFRAPQFASSIAPVFHKFSEFTIGHGRLGNRERGNLNFVRWLFVIEDEALSRHASQSEFAAGYFCVACPVVVNNLNIISLLCRNPDCGRGIAQSLACVSDCFIVHLLM